LVESDITEQFYISAAATPADERPRVLKFGELFAVFNRYGDIAPSGLGEEGLFYEGTRYLSEFGLYLGSSRPLLLSSTISRDNFLFSADLTNVDISAEGDIRIPRGTLHLHRSKFIWNGLCYDKFRIGNYGIVPLTIPLRLTIDADFADIFEVRGTKRKRKGTRLRDAVTQDSATLSYKGLDGVVRRCVVMCSPAPTGISASGVLFKASLQPKEENTFHVITSCVDRDGAPPDWETAFSAGRQTISAGPLNRWQISSSNRQFNGWIHRSVADIRTMIDGNPESDYPYAGIPWFNTVFGRDGIITAMECLWLSPSIGRGVLSYLASTQATSVDPGRDAEPGKILHEMRKGEMAALSEVPFGMYYGGVDSTPLFLMLAAEYYPRTGDRAFIESLWPHLEAALDWIDNYGDRDGDGFVEYERQSANGLSQQGWKDSHDSVFHDDGKLADPPVALCEVQGYVYAAKRGVSALAAMLGRKQRAKALSDQAEALKNKFNEAFWSEEIGMYVLALDGNKRPCRVRSSNAGQCLFTGIATPEHADGLVRNLMTEQMFSGWGIRTVASSEARYNPISYHDGSVWPHDNALIARGLPVYGYNHVAAHLLDSMLDVSTQVDFQRLPELICGLHRREGEGPTLYPVACSPQAWAAASVFALLQSALGVTVDATQRRICFSRPALPPSITALRIRGIQVGSDRVDLALETQDGIVEVGVLDNKGEIEVVTER
jgi:glycogen debranching enzyme